MTYIEAIVEIYINIFCDSTIWHTIWSSTNVIHITSDASDASTDVAILPNPCKEGTSEADEINVPGDLWLPCDAVMQYLNFDQILIT